MPTAARRTHPILTLTTDFGTSDHFAGVLKGVILGICPAARIADITHEIRPFEISEGAFVIAQSYRAFPKGTVHVVVVDPGVGSARRPILVEAAGQYFIGPDNGVLSMVYGKEKHKVRELTAEKYFRHPVSRTFHGRDIFAPVAAHLAAGVRPAAFGKLINDYLKITFDAPARSGKRVWAGTILKIDRFGNLITNFHIGEFDASSPGPSRCPSACASCTASRSTTPRSKRPSPSSSSAAQATSKSHATRRPRPGSSAVVSARPSNSCSSEYRAYRLVSRTARSSLKTGVCRVRLPFESAACVRVFPLLVSIHSTRYRPAGTASCSSSARSAVSTWYFGLPSGTSRP